MIYELCQLQEDATAQASPLALDTCDTLRAWNAGGPQAGLLHQAAAAFELLANSGPVHRRPRFGLDRVQLGGRAVEVREETVLTLPFGTLLRFAKDVADPGPRVLVVAPLSGHYATRLRDTVRVLLPEHDVYVTDWTDAREVPVAAGPFGLDDMVEYIMAFLQAIGPGAHLLAVSQAAVTALAAAALMAEDGGPARPRSLTLIGGPLDTRVSPTRDNLTTRFLPIAWFEGAMTGIVPRCYRGAGRRVYPGALMLATSVAKDLGRHATAYVAQLFDSAAGDLPAAERRRAFYAELRSVMDVAADLYLDTIRRVFQEHELARGRMSWRGHPVRPEAIRDTVLLTVEGERDTTCPAGQTQAALALCPGLDRAMKRHHVQPGVDHDGLFEGPRWAAEVYPVVRAAIRSSAA